MTAPASAYRIDTHNHIVPPTWLSRHRTEVLAAMDEDRVSDWTPGRALEDMDRNGIGAAITSITTPGVWFGDVGEGRSLTQECNEYAASLARDHKGRFGFFATLPLPDIEGSLRAIEYAFDVLSADGIGILTNYDDRWPGDIHFAPLFDELNRRRAVVFFHPAAPKACTGIMPGINEGLVEFAFDTTRAIVSLLFSGTVRRYPDIRWIFSHGGGTLPMVAGRIARIAERSENLRTAVGDDLSATFGQFYYDVASLFHPIGFDAARSIAGTSHLLFGTDVPFWPPEVNLTALQGQALAPSELRAIERDNALLLFPRFNDIQ